MLNDCEQTRLQQAQAFDQNALAAIYDDYHHAIYRYIYRRVGEVETARDLTAEVFQRLLQAFHKGHGPDRQLKAWLYRTAHNGVVDYYRRQQHRRHLALNEAVAAPDGDPVQTAAHHILAEKVRGALPHLTPDQQQVITLKFLAGLSNEEVAAALDKPVGAVKSLQHRALAALQKRLRLGREKIVL